MPVTDYDDCWLRYDRVRDDDRRAAYRRLCTHVYASDRAPELGAAREELRNGLSGLLDREPHLWQHPPRSVEGFLVMGHPDELRVIDETVDRDRVESLDDDGYLLKTATWEGTDVLVVTAPTDAGVLRGVFHLLRLLSMEQPITDLDVAEEPANAERVINHWDNPFRGSIERGYGGRSIFDWERLPDLRERYFDYARLLASVGINGIVLNNVNTGIPSRPGENEATAGRHGWQLLASENLSKVEALATVFRRYGITTYLSVNYAAPMRLGGLDTADPLDEDVEQWWAEKADEVYDVVPDFGGFLVKADSEGQPGPYDYDRNHAEGANVIARALAPHGGRVWWRAFVYADHDDRAVEAYETFEPLDGEFAENVTVQIKNGPIDFQPREPVSTLFGSMDDTAVGCELQITQEYTGQGVFTCYLVPQWKEVLEFDTHADGPGTPVKDVLGDSPGEGIAGVGGPGEDRNWTGHYLSQANLYGFGRLVWNPDLDTETITDEWVRLTFGTDPTTVEAVTDILHDSWDAVIDFETGGIGLMHMMYNGNDVLENHYDPSPREWPEYTGIAEDGIGVDRTATGSDYVSQYADPVAERYADPDTCPEELLLFFHHLPWDHELSDGATVIQRLYDRCFAGVEQSRDLRGRWAALDDRIDEERHRHVAERLDEQVEQSKRWRDTLVDYFYEYAGIPDEKGRVPADE
ncbi:xylan alpha-(1-_2)-glucuronosidase [Halorubrum gandharaense]